MRETCYIKAMTEQKDFDYTRYFELKKQLEEASRLYYKEGVSPMSDQDFDFGLKEMEALEAKYRNCAVRVRSRSGSVAT